MMSTATAPVTLASSIVAADRIRMLLMLIGLLLPCPLAAAEALQKAVHERDPLAVGNHMRRWLPTANAPLAAQELTLLARILQHPQVGHQAMQSLALSSMTYDVAAQYAETGQGALLGARILAVDAVLRRTFDRASAKLPAPEEPVADPTPFATSYSRQWSKLPVISAADRQRLATALVNLISHRNPEIRATASIAAANYGLATEELTAAIEQLKDQDGPTPGARLLYLVRTGVIPERGQFEQAMNARRGQPAMLKQTSPLLCVGSVITPSAALTCEAIGELQGSDAEAHLALLHQALQHDDLRVQIEAARALGRIGSSESAVPLADRLQKCEWPVGIAASLALTTCRHPEAIPRLIERLKGLNGRARQHVLYALSAITGNQYGKVSVQEWSDWWQKHKERFAVDDEASQSYLATYGIRQVSTNTSASFYNLPIVSSSFAMVIDRSGSMSGERMQTLKDKCHDTLRSIEPGTKFNIISYSSDFDRFSETLTTNRSAGYAYIQSLEASGGTNIYDPTFSGLVLQGIDSIYLLTDGQPNEGQFTRWLDITASLVLLNRYRPVAIHTVCFQAGAHTARQMEQLSLMTDGDHVAFE